jgi:hypothetical protein
MIRLSLPCLLLLLLLLLLNHYYHSRTEFSARPKMTSARRDTNSNRSPVDALVYVLPT